MEEFEQSENIRFKCPFCGVISQDDVIFLCNTCGQTKMVLKEGIYICPACLTPGENFECAKCGSKEVTMRVKSK